MPRVNRLYIDTNVFIRLFESSDEISRLLAELFLADRTGRETFLATSEITLAELLVEPYRRKEDHLIQIYDNWTTTNDHITVVPISRDVLRSAAVLRSKHTSLKLPDAIHLSAAAVLRCSHVLTADQSLRERYDVAHHGFGHPKGAVRLDIIRPESDVIRQLIEEAAR
jgi:predicted nucleic acid-binding protein